MFRHYYILLNYIFCPILKFQGYKEFNTVALIEKLKKDKNPKYLDMSPNTI
jgi:hypothetical protein